jgi:hypothetical protein
MKWLLPLILLTAHCPAFVNAADNPLHTEDAARIQFPFVDRVRNGLKIRLAKYTRYFDNFFVDERAEEEAGDSQIRMIGILDYREARGMTFTPRVRARINLPNLKRKVNLLIDTEDSDINSLSDQTPDINPGTPNEDTSIALQLVQESTARFGIGHRIGLSMKNERLNPKARSQMRFTWQTPEKDLLRFTQAIFWERFTGFGQESRFDYEHLLHNTDPQLSSLLRLTLRGLSSEKSDGYEWSIPLEILNGLPGQRAYSYGGSISGVTKSDSGITNSAVFIRYRQRLWRDWIYVDVSPQLEWPKSNGRSTTARITLSLEVIM